MSDLGAQHRRQVLHDEPHESFRVEGPPRPEGEAPDVRHKAPALSRAAAETRSTLVATAVFVTIVVAGAFLTATHGGLGCRSVVVQCLSSTAAARPHEKRGDAAMWGAVGMAEIKKENGEEKNTGG